MCSSVQFCTHSRPFFHIRPFGQAVLYFIRVLVFSLHVSNVVCLLMFLLMSEHVCVCEWTAVSAVAYTQPCCSSSFTICVYYCKNVSDEQINKQTYNPHPFPGLVALSLGWTRMRAFLAVHPHVLRADWLQT